MASLDLRLFIHAPPERVWQVISDLPAQKAWMVDLRSLEFTTPQQSGVGADMDVTSEFFGLPVVKDKMRITAWEPPYRFDVEHHGAFAGTGSFLLKEAPGGTTFVWLEDFRPPLGMLGETAFSLLVRPHLHRVFTRSMDNVRRLAEEA